MNFDQTFIIVIKTKAFQVLFTIITYYNLDIEKMYIKTVFLPIIINQVLRISKFFMDMSKTKKIRYID